MNDISSWKKEVYAYNSEINNRLKQNEDTKSLYYGFKVIDGSIIKNPDILFIGINPGKGSGERHHEVIMNTDSISYSHVFNKNYREDYPRKYVMAEFAINLIEKIGVPKEEIKNYLQQKCIKTNIYHIITNGTGQIKPTLNTIRAFGDYWKNSHEYCKALIKLTKPKLVIFEGKAAYNMIVQDGYAALNTWNENGTIAYYKMEDLNVDCVGYKRNRGGGIEANANELAEMIKRHYPQSV